jgi:hypothetical protein
VLGVFGGSNRRRASRLAILTLALNLAQLVVGLLLRVGRIWFWR